MTEAPHSYPETAGLRAFANARKDAESQLGTLDKALRMRVERRMREESVGDAQQPSDLAREAEKPSLAMKNLHEASSIPSTDRKFANGLSVDEYWKIRDEMTADTSLPSPEGK